jgi:glycerol-3-phosphate acyltransferase PlsY
MLVISIITAIAYLLGSIPSSVWLGKITRGIDLRDHGSGNAGTSNAFRVLGWKIGLAVLIIDILKGYLAVYLSVFQNQWAEGTEGWMAFRIVLGLVAVAGHIFPVFASFRGGKGVATLAGAGFAIHPYATLAALGVYLFIFILFRISSLGSLGAAISYPLWIMIVFREGYLSLSIFSLLVTLTIILTHLPNIRRLIKGEERTVKKNSIDSVD